MSHNWSLMTHGCTNYHFLVERLDEWARNNSECVGYVTFNYDTLLERAIEDAGPKLHFNDLSDYVAHPRLKVFKLHGSCDWAHT
ncbi:MAG: SIR2 family protein, partial [Acidimicrobiales bacterium]